MRATPIAAICRHAAAIAAYAFLRLFMMIRDTLSLFQRDGCHYFSLFYAHAAHAVPC